MMVFPFPKKTEKTVQACQQLLSKESPQILEVAGVIGIILSTLL